MADWDTDTRPTITSRNPQRDLDIDELMQGVHTGAATANSVLGVSSSETPVQQLIRHWMNERHAPDLLPFQEHLLSGILDHIARQMSTIHTLRTDPSITTSSSEHIRVMLVQTEIERIKFIVRSYIRTRLFKIEKYARHITINPDIQSRISASEKSFAIRHARLTDNHFYRTVLQSLPESQAHLDDTPVFMPPMVTEPDKSKAVFVHALTSCPPILLPDGAQHEMEKGHISLLPFAVAEQLVLRGEVELV